MPLLVKPRGPARPFSSLFSANLEPSPVHSTEPTLTPSNQSVNRETQYGAEAGDPPTNRIAFLVQSIHSVPPGPMIQRVPLSAVHFQ